MGPGGGILRNHAPQGRLHLLVLPFHLAIGLGMKAGG